jgi:hypothetical protein
MAGPEIKPYSMSAIKSKLLNPALTSHFICRFSPPKGNFGKYRTDRVNVGFEGFDYSGENQELIELSCSEASLPGSSLATIEINNDYTGVTERHAYRRLYDDRADFTFYVDGNYYIIDYFENWIAYISGEDDIKTQESLVYNYRVNFPEKYTTGNLYITKFERNYGRKKIDSNLKETRPLTYKFINAYPISINSMPVSYDNSQLLKCTISFTYSRYVISRDPNLFAKSDEYNLFFNNPDIKALANKGTLRSLGLPVPEV